jgi:hypothetical protein
LHRGFEVRYLLPACFYGYCTHQHGVCYPSKRGILPV